MKAFLCLNLIVLIAAAATATTNSGTSTSSNLNTQTKLDLETDTPQSIQSLLNTDFGRFRKSAGYGGGAASIPAPPCPKNYLFSCQPNLAPVPCAAPAASYGSAGAYSAPVPTYVAPVGNNYGLPQTYSGFMPQTMNQWYY
ncbi:vitelline membrane protein Vm26Aa-like [Lucilia sericata]|uniref:vitelline membrane protein Vm26Aa-like n=1 Tax=Lucilia sericata TaxID=13632 RepID=UPI0018A83D35|nr:vitelline membrane protein Vm26Aa-like [Lucilia sericata]